MAYQAFISGKFVGPKYKYRQDAESYVARHFKIDLDKIHVELESRRSDDESRSWEVSDARGDNLVILGYVVEL